MKFIVISLLILATVVAGGMWVQDNATVTECHEKKLLWVEYGQECVTTKMFS